MLVDFTALIFPALSVALTYNVWFLSAVYSGVHTFFVVVLVSKFEDDTVVQLELLYEYCTFLIPDEESDKVAVIITFWFVHSPPLGFDKVTVGPVVSIFMLVDFTVLTFPALSVVLTYNVLFWFAVYSGVHTFLVVVLVSKLDG